MKLAFKLSEKVLHPKALEQTNVKLANNLFHETTIAELEFESKDDPEYNSTAAFMKIIRQYGNIVNVKSPNKGLRKRDPTSNPIRKENRESLDFLHKFTKWKGESNFNFNKLSTRNKYNKQEKTYF